MCQIPNYGGCLRYVLAARLQANTILIPEFKNKKQLLRFKKYNSRIKKKSVEICKIIQKNFSENRTKGRWGGREKEQEMVNRSFFRERIMCYISNT